MRSVGEQTEAKRVQIQRNLSLFLSKVQWRTSHSGLKTHTSIYLPTLQSGKQNVSAHNDFLAKSMRLPLHRAVRCFDAVNLLETPVFLLQWGGN